MSKKSAKVIKIFAVVTAFMLIAAVAASLSACNNNSGETAENVSTESVSQQQSSQTVQDNSGSDTNATDVTQE